MKPRKLTKEDLDKVRNIEGFPIGKDEDIIALSDAPYYSACPNPFIEEFIKECGTPYDEAVDEYQREPFTSDISEGKHDPLYMAHSYHTKVPYKAIMRYILHYTKPGDIVFDGFCGTGMTGVAAQLCSDYSTCFILGETDEENIGSRNAILCDLSPEASFIAYNYTSKFNALTFEKIANQILDECRKECGWVYETNHNNGSTKQKGWINYVIWSEVYICPNCSQEINYWEAAVEKNHEKMKKKPVCPFCGAEIKKGNCQKALTLISDEQTGETTEQAKCIPVRIVYDFGGKRYSKEPDEADIEIINRINASNIGYWYPTNLMMGKGKEWGDYWRQYHIGITRVNHFYFKRNLFVLAKCYNCIEKIEDKRIRSILKFWLSSIYSRSHKLNRYMPDHHRHVGPLSGTLYIPFFQAEINIISLLKDKLNSVFALNVIPTKSCVSVQSSTDLRNIPDNSVDYIFVDPPFGDNLHYSELNYIQETWLKVETNNQKEAIINVSQHKGLADYQSLMEQSFSEFYRIIKPNRWITIEFHNSKNAVWNSIQEAIQKAGFIIADVRTLDKQKGTTKQLSYSMAVKQDLVISAYRPTEKMRRHIIEMSGSPETAWTFVSQYLANLPKVVDANNDGKIDIIPERQAFLLFDRMVAYHIINGIPVPIDATDFYAGLESRYLKRDTMYFLPDQVNEYDSIRMKKDVEDIQFSFAVSNERTAIEWLYYQLRNPQTYSEIQPKFMQEVKAIDKYEAMPELSILLEENFLQNEKGQWYIPDITKEADVTKLREKKLLKEFDNYLAIKGKLKLFRTEAIRAGFAKLWADENYKLIVDTAERLPEKIVQEDNKLLMYYDISLRRI